MQRTVRLKLEPTPEQTSALIETIKQHTACYNVVARYGWDSHTKNGVTLHKATYYALREQFPKLPSQLVVSARMRATESLVSAFTLRKKKNSKGQLKKVSCPHATFATIRFDARSYRFNVKQSFAHLSTVAGRLPIAFKAYAWAKTLIAQAKGFDSADLIYRNGHFFLHLVVTLPEPDIATSDQVVGVDFGETRPAVTSNNLFVGSRRWKGIERRYFRLKRQLQSKGTRSAKRKLKRLSQTVTRFRSDCDHVVSRRVVDSVEHGSTIVVENLTEIRTNGKRRGTEQRRQFHQWTFARLREMITYKAEAKGCSVVGIDPRHTSQTCSQCGYQHRSNRKSQSVFCCRECNYQLNADLNGARNIARKHLVSGGISAAGGRSVNTPIVTPSTVAVR
ncbi:RNA-guided endonuclease TnpB family protein [soil metagenome]